MLLCPPKSPTLTDLGLNPDHPIGRGRVYIPGLQIQPFCQIALLLLLVSVV
jgi:hypothetical protein